MGLHDEELLKEMTNEIEHRGPDSFGYFLDGKCMLGNRRLKIIDLSARGKMPMSNKDETIWITYNGEVYNHLELRKELGGKYRYKSNSDTESILHGYEEWGTKVFRKLRGDFAVAIWDSKKKKLILARDHVGVKPLYYHLFKGGIVFASEIKAILKSRRVRREVDEKALNEYFSLRYAVGPRTLFKGISKLLPGEVLEFKDGKAKLSKYWSLEFKERNCSEEKAARDIRGLLEESVRLRLMSDVPLGAFLSGGLDSSFMVALMARNSKNKVNTFSVDFGLREDESKYARVLAEKFETNHKEIRVDSSNYSILPEVCWHLDAPPADIAAVPTYLMSKETKRYVTVVLTGDGGDEVFGGYSRYRRLPFVKKLSPLLPALSVFSFLSSPMVGKEPSERLREVMRSRTHGELFLAYNSAFSEAEKKKVYENKELMKLAEGKEMQKELQQWFKQGDFANEMFSFDIETLLPDDYLMKVDLMTMANGVESRVPFLDCKLLEYSATLPPGMKVSLRESKRIMRKAMRGLVPDEIIERKKHGFNVPTKQWLENGLREIAEEMLDEKALEKRGLLKHEIVRKVIFKHDRNELYYSRQFWAVFALEIWFRVFMDPEEVRKPGKLESLI